MNFQQLEYIVAIAREGQFTRAAEHCHVTQATLSMMVRKLEDELGITIFDRNRHPVQPTNEGREVLDRAQRILHETAMLRAYAQEQHGEVTGDVRIGVIPTLAPYLLPLFLTRFSNLHPELRISVRELVTDRIAEGLLNGSVDIGLLATPLDVPRIAEHKLFYEAFFAYAAETEKLPAKRYILPTQINPEHLWLLEEGHCMRSQLLRLCELVRREESHTLHYAAGSIETLIHLVDQSGGITIIPQLATRRLSAAQKKKLRAFAPPVPVREISLVTHENYPRETLIRHLKDGIMYGLRKHLALSPEGMQVLGI